MQLQDLAAFLAVADDRSFSSAARRLHRTQPAISQAVRRIEDELGERLFDRSSRDGTLTEAGRLLQGYAQRLLGLAGEAEVAVRELQQVRRGRVILGANEAAVHTPAAVCRAVCAAASQASPSRSGACRRGRWPTRCWIAPSISACSRFSRPTRNPDDAARRRRPRPAGLAATSAATQTKRVTLEEVGRRTSSPTTIRRPPASACCASTSGAHVHQYPDLASEPRRHQARGRNGDRRGSAPAPMRADRDRARPPGRRASSGARRDATGPARVSENRRAESGGGGVPGCRASRPRRRARKRLTRRR